MNQSEGVGVNLQQAQAFLAQHFATEPADVVLVGEGAWSRCFGFRQGDEDLVVRFGNYRDDFEKDQQAYQYHSSALPIPRVLEIGQAFGGYYAFSTRAHGIPLENVSASQWQAVVPTVVDALEGLRLADLSTTTKFGGWGKERHGSHDHWSSFLLAVGDDTPDRRTYGWRNRLATYSSAGETTFHWGYDLLQRVVSDAIPRNLLHCDLINRNVLVDGDHISGVFDWGCSIYGDHLYELAWFEFWAPWHTNLDIPYLRSKLERRWHDVGYVPVNKAARLTACYLHIGLDHLAYNAYTGNWETLLATAERMRTLVSVR